MTSGSGVQVGKAFVHIRASVEGLQKDVTEELKRTALEGKKTGKQLGENLTKATDKELKGKGRRFGKVLGDDAVRAFEGAFRGIKLGAVTGVFSSLTTAALGGFSSVVSGALEASDATDKFKATMDFAGLDTSAIETATQRVREYADKTVYGLGDIQNMAAQLASNGVKDYLGLAEAAGNLNAVAGGNADTFKSVGMVMSQTAGAGKLTTENFNQLADAIPGASGQLQKALLEAGAYTGNFRDEMAKGEITAEEFNAAVMALGSQPIAQEAAQSTETFEGMLGNLQATVEGALADAFNQLKPIIGDVVNGIGRAAEVVLPKLVDVVKRAADGISKFTEFVKENKEWLGPLAAAATGAATALGGIMLAAKIQAAGGFIKFLMNATKFTKLWAGAQLILNGVMALNPFTLAIVGISALTAGLVWFFKKTETGQKLWKDFTDALGNVWEGLKGKFQAGYDKVKEIWENLKTLFTPGGLKDAINNAIGDSPLAEKFEAIKEKFNGLKDIATQGWDGAKGAFDLFLGWAGTWLRGWGDTFKDILGTVITAAWENIKTIFVTQWLVLKALVTGNWGEIPGILKAALVKVWDTITGALGQIGQSLAEWWHSISERWAAFGDQVVAFVTTAWDNVKRFFVEGTQSVLDTLARWVGDAVQAFSDLVSQITTSVSQVPGKVSETFNNAGSWLLQAGKNILSGLWDGLKSKWNEVSSWLGGLKDKVLSAFRGATDAASTQMNYTPGHAAGGVVLPAYANGGRLPTTGPGTNVVDGILGVDGRGMPIARVNAGEFVVNADATRKFLPLLYAINGGRLSPRMGDMGLPGYADGGVVGAADIMKFVRGGSLAGANPPGSLEGYPYTWGGGLNSSWGDCSGLMSAIAAAVAGVSAVGRKFATGTQGAWLSAHGFKRGRGPGKNAFETGFFNGGPYGGHTAGTVFDENGHATNLEMGGARGNGQIGGRAVGSRDSSFTDIYWHPLKGGSTGGSATDDGVELPSGEGRKGDAGGFGTATGLFELAKRGVRLFDTGGLLRSGQLAFNAGPNEHVMSPYQWDKLVAGLEKLATAVKDGDFGYKAIEKHLGSRASSMAMELTGGALGGWVADTQLLQDAEKGLAEVRRKATADNADVKKAEEKLSKAKLAAERDLTIAREKHGADAKKMAKAQEAASAKVRHAELELEQARKAAGANVGEFAAELKAAEEAVEAARRASLSKGFNDGGNLTALWEQGTLSDLVGAASDVTGALGGVTEKLTGFASSILGAGESLKAAYDSQADAQAALVGAEADLRAARESGDAAAIAEAEKNLGSARSTVAKIAAATGRAEIAAAVNVATTVYNAVKGVVQWVEGLFQNFHAHRIVMAQALAKQAEATAKLSQMVFNLRGQVSGFLVDVAMAYIQLGEATRNVHMTQIAGAKAAARATVDVAKAQKAFDAQRLLDARMARATFQDLSREFRDFRWTLEETSEVFLGTQAAWSDESRALYAQLQLEQKKFAETQLQNQLNMLDATYKQQVAVSKLNRATANLQVAAKKLALAQGVGDGTGTVVSMKGQKVMDLVAKIGKLKAENATVGGQTWDRWTGARGARDHAIQQYTNSLKELLEDSDLKAAGYSMEKIEQSLDVKWWQGLFGDPEKFAKKLENGPLGDLSRNLEMIEFKNSILDQQAAEANLELDVSDGLAEIAHLTRSQPLKVEMDALRLDQDSLSALAEAYREEQGPVRDALVTMSEQLGRFAQEVRDNQATVQISGTYVDVESLAGELKALGIKVERKDVPNALQVAHSYR